MYFPKAFGRGNSEIEENGAILNLLKAGSDILLEDNDKTRKALFVAEKDILELQDVNVWNVYAEGNMEIEMEVDFEKYMLAVSEHTNENMETMSTFRFYAMQEYLKEKHEKSTVK